MITAWKNYKAKKERHRLEKERYRQWCESDEGKLRAKCIADCEKEMIDIIRKHNMGLMIWCMGNKIDNIFLCPVFDELCEKHDGYFMKYRFIDDEIAERMSFKFIKKAFNENI